MPITYSLPRYSTEEENLDTRKAIVECDDESPYSSPKYSMSSPADLNSSWDYDMPINCSKRMLGAILKSDYLKQLQKESIFRRHPNATSLQPCLNDCSEVKEVFSFDQIELANGSPRKLHEVEEQLTHVLYTTEKLEPKAVSGGGIIRHGKYHYTIPRVKRPRNVKVRFADCDVKENFSGHNSVDDDERGCNFILEYLQCLGPSK